MKQILQNARTGSLELGEVHRDGRPSPFGLEEIAAVSKATFAMLESVRAGREARIEP